MKARVEANSSFFVLNSWIVCHQDRDDWEEQSAAGSNGSEAGPEVEIGVPS